MSNIFDQAKKKIEIIKTKQPTIFFIGAVVVVYLLYKLVVGWVQKGRIEKITAQVNASNEAIQKSNSNESATAVRGETMQGIARSIKQVVDNYGFFEQWISFNPTPYIQDINRLNGANEARYISQWYNQQFGRSLKTDLQMIAYSENSFLGNWTAKGGRYSDIKEDVRNAL
ncbi:MAG: hypothetical protein DI598_14955, partial [Pseudopedobacter saltans]